MKMEAFAQTAIAYRTMMDSDENMFQDTERFFAGCLKVCSIACQVSEDRIHQACVKLHDQAAKDELWKELTVGFFRDNVAIY